MRRTGPARTFRMAAAATASLALLLPTAAAADTTTPSPSGSGNKVVFTVGILNDIDSLNPYTGILAESYEVYQLMYGYLMDNAAADFSPVGDLATSWTTSPDGKTWTYTIRSGVTWSDGVPLTASDVAYSFNRVMKGEYEQTNYGNYVTNIATVTATNPTTVVMVTKVPTPIMTHLLVPILPEHIWSKISETAVKSYANDKNVVGAGPFLLAEHSTGQFVRLVRNPHYYRGEPKIDEVVFRVYKNSDAMVQALKKGEIDFADSLDFDVWQSLKGVQGITTFPSKYTGFDELAFNTGAALSDGTPIGNGNPALKNKTVRQALNYAVDRKTLLQKVIGGTGTEGSSIIPPIYPKLHYNPPSPYTFDPAKANQLLDQAGYKRGADGMRTTPAGKPLTLRLYARTESQNSQRMAPFIKGWLHDVGIPVTVKVVSNDSLTEIIGQGTYDMFLWGWVVEPDPDYQLSTFTCGQRSYKDSGTIYAALSDSFYCNPTYDALYAKQASQIDPAQRAATVQQMQQMLYDDAPYAVIWYYDDTVAYSSRFTGFVPQPAPDGVYLFQYGIWSYLNIQLASTKSSESSGNSGLNTATVVAVGAGAAVIVGGIALLLGRRRRRDHMDVQ